MELELGDVPRYLTPPYCKWNDREPDIVNTIYPYRGIAADPLGINPPVGGELNTIPTTTIEKQVEIVSAILSYFREHDATPTASCVSHTHVHVHVPNLTEDLWTVKKLIAFAYNHQDELIDYSDIPADDYLLYDSRRKYPREHVIELFKVRSFPELYSSLLINKEEIRNYEAPKRYFINFLSLQDNETIEFRFFNSTVDIKEIENILRFTRSLLDAALNDKELDRSIQLPRFRYDHELFVGWKQTKHKIITTQHKQRKRQKPII